MRAPLDHATPQTKRVISNTSSPGHGSDGHCANRLHVAYGSNEANTWGRIRVRMLPRERRELVIGQKARWMILDCEAQRDHQVMLQKPFFERRETLRGEFVEDKTSLGGEC